MPDDEEDLDQPSLPDVIGQDADAVEQGMPAAAFGTADELIGWFGHQDAESKWPGLWQSEGGLCQCGSERYVTQTSDPSLVRSFPIAAVQLDRIAYGALGDKYNQFRERFRLPKLGGDCRENSERFYGMRSR